MNTIHQRLQTAATSGNGVAAEIDAEASFLTAYITPDTGVVSAGAITFEEAPIPDYTGTWSPMTSDTGGSGAITIVATTTIARHFSGSFGFVRARLSTALTGGATVTVDLFG